MKKLLLLLTSIVGLCFASCCSDAASSTQDRSSKTSSAVQTQSSSIDISSQQTSSEIKTDSKEDSEMKLDIDVEGKHLTAALADSRAAQELAQKLKEGPIKVLLEEYGGFEKVGSLPWSLTKDDEQTDTEPCDIMLYQGDKMTIFYGTNSWSYTRLGRLENITQEELKSILGEGDVKVTLSLK